MDLCFNLIFFFSRESWISIVRVRSLPLSKGYLVGFKDLGFVLGFHLWQGGAVVNRLTLFLGQWAAALSKAQAQWLGDLQLREQVSTKASPTHLSSLPGPRLPRTWSRSPVGIRRAWAVAASEQEPRGRQEHHSCLNNDCWAMGACLAPCRAVAPFPSMPHQGPSLVPSPGCTVTNRSRRAASSRQWWPPEKCSDLRVHLDPWKWGWSDNQLGFLLSSQVGRDPLPHTGWIWRSHG